MEMVYFCFFLLEMEESCPKAQQNTLLNGLPYIRLDSLYFFRTILWHFEGVKNQLVELYNKTTIVAQGKIPGPEKSLLNLIQWQYL